MRQHWQNRAGLILVVALATSCAVVIVTRADSRPRAASEEIVACRVLEVHTVLQLRMTVAVFHHQNEKERARLGDLLRRHSEAPVEFQTASGTWQSGTVLRLKSCFGRGLLLFPAGTAQLAERDTFLLKFPRD